MFDEERLNYITERVNEIFDRCRPLPMQELTGLSTKDIRYGKNLCISICSAVVYLGISTLKAVR